MTTIVWRSPMLAADTQVTCGDGSKSRVSKLRPMPGGGFYGCAGDSGAVLRMERWLDRGMPKRGCPRVRGEIEIDVLLVKPDGTAWMLNDSLIFEQRNDKFLAIGTGAPYALGAMSHGRKCSARQAIKVAARFDTNTSAPIDAVMIFGMAQP